MAFATFLAESSFISCPAILGINCCAGMPLCWIQSVGELVSMGFEAMPHQLNQVFQTLAVVCADPCSVGAAVRDFHIV